MKKLIIAVSALMVSVGAYGQGQFYFSNKDVTASVDARFVLPSDAAGTSSVGTDYTFTLLGGAKGTPVANLVALGLPDGSTGSMRGAAGSKSAGYVSPGTSTVAGVAIGASADILVKITGPGGTFSQLFNVAALGGGTATPPTLAMGATALSLTPTAVPEPATLALGALGLGALLAIRRRK